MQYWVLIEERGSGASALPVIVSDEPLGLSPCTGASRRHPLLTSTHFAFVTAIRISVDGDFSRTSSPDQIAIGCPEEHVALLRNRLQEGYPMPVKVISPGTVHHSGCRQPRGARTRAGMAPRRAFPAVRDIRRPNAARSRSGRRDGQRGSRPASSGKTPPPEARSGSAQTGPAWASPRPSARRRARLAPAKAEYLGERQTRWNVPRRLRRPSGLYTERITSLPWPSSVNWMI